MFGHPHTLRLLALLALLAVPSAGVGQRKSRGGVHSNVISLPQGAITTIPSPNQDWTLIFEFPNMYKARKLWIQHKGSNDRRLVREFDRSLEISWSPDSQHFFVNDASGSGETRPYVYDPATLQSIDLAAVVGKASPKADDYLGADHSYLDAKYWSNSHEVLVKMTAYFSEPLPKRPGLIARYRVDLNGTVHTVYERYWGSACDGIDRALTAHRKTALAPEIAKQLKVSSVDVLQSFRFGTWQIIYVSTPESDPPFLFYPGDPLQTRYVTEWSGSARTDEEQEINAWTLENAPGIPRKLASCFAWHVTKSGDY
jgi:hypothetical protein